MELVLASTCKSTVPFPARIEECMKPACWLSKLTKMHPEPALTEKLPGVASALILELSGFIE
jgi:hypothetical protein